MKTRYITGAVAIAVFGLTGSLFLSHPSHTGTSPTASVSAGALASAIPGGTTGTGGATGGGSGAGAKPGIPQASDFVSPSSGKYLGISLLSGEPGLAAYNKKTGIPANIQEEFLNFGQAPPVAHIVGAYEQHALTVLSWQPEKAPLASIIAGREDSYITSFAGDLAQSGVPVGVIFAPEFNGGWESWGAKGTEHATPAQYVAAWRRIHSLFIARGASNVIWIWAPNVINPVPKIDLEPYWPGDQFVDWVGMSAYWTGHLGEDSWATLIEPTEKKVEAFTNAPVVITETGAMQGPSKVKWISAMLAGLKSDPHVLGMIYLNSGIAEGKRANWTFTDDAPDLAAWRAGAKELVTVPVNK